MIESLRRRLSKLASVVLRPYALLLRRCSGNLRQFDTREFPWIAELEEHTAAMRDEFLAVDEASVPSLNAVLAGDQPLAGDGWRLLALRYWSFDVAENCRQCPRTWELVRDVPGMTMAAFSVLEGGERIPTHRGVYPGLLRCHVPLMVPVPAESCRLCIDAQTLHWQLGRAIVFDDSFEHEVWNDSDQRRIVLMIDVKRPLPQPLRTINDLLTRLACAVFVLGTTNWNELTVRENRHPDYRDLLV